MDFKIGDEVKLNHDGNCFYERNNQGSIKYVGTISSSNGDEIYYGIELQEWTPNTIFYNEKIKEISNVYVEMNGNPGRGYLAHWLEIEPKPIYQPDGMIYQQKKEFIEDDDDYSEELSIGDRVLLANKRKGQVVFYGAVHFDEEEVYGIILDEWSPNGHAGIIHGHRYFIAENGKGYFSRGKYLRKINE